MSLRSQPAPRTVSAAPEYRQREEESDQAEHADAEVPRPEAHERRPEREHDAGEDDSDETDAAEVDAPLRPVPQPDVVTVGHEHLLLGDADDPDLIGRLDGSGWRRRGRSARLRRSHHAATIHPQEMGRRQERVQQRPRSLLIVRGQLGHAAGVGELRVGIGSDGLDRARAWAR